MRTFFKIQLEVKVVIVIPACKFEGHLHTERSQIYSVRDQTTQVSSLAAARSFHETPFTQDQSGTDLLMGESQ